MDNGSIPDYQFGQFDFRGSVINIGEYCTNKYFAELWFALSFVRCSVSALALIYLLALPAPNARDHLFGKSGEHWTIMIRRPSSTPSRPVFSTFTVSPYTELPVSSVCRVFLMRPWSRQVLPLVCPPFSQIVPSTMMLFMCASGDHYGINHFSCHLCRHMDATNRLTRFLVIIVRLISPLAAFSAHLTGRFLPWHRLYLHTMEGLLKHKCGYTGHMTYWDWTIGGSDKWGSLKWSLTWCSVRFTRHRTFSSSQCRSNNRFWNIPGCQHQLLP